jgi:hypothetical protein
MGKIRRNWTGQNLISFLRKSQRKQASKPQLSDLPFLEKSNPAPLKIVEFRTDTYADAI